MSKSRNQKLTVAYDFQIFSLQKFGGISKYFSELIYNMKTTSIEAKLPFLFHVNSHLRPALAQNKILCQGETPEQRGICCDLNLHHRPKLVEADIYHSTYYIEDFVDFLPNTPAVVTVHDMIPEKLPHLFSSNPHMAKLHYVNRAQKIICVSENTKRDLVDCYGVPDEKVAVVHHGIDPMQHQKTKEVSDLPSRFFLFIGPRGGYKNFTTLLQAFAKCEPILTDYKLVCVGGGKFDPHELAEISACRDGSVIRYDLDDFELRYTLGRAAALVLPSIYEGFCLPILEAMIQSCPVILARASCFPEIARKSALYFEATDVDELAASMVRIVRDGELADRFRKQGRMLVKEYSIEKMVQETAAVYRSIM